MIALNHSTRTMRAARSERPGRSANTTRTTRPKLNKKILLKIIMSIIIVLVLSALIAFIIWYLLNSSENKTPKPESGISDNNKTNPNNLESDITKPTPIIKPITLIKKQLARLDTDKIMELRQLINSHMLNFTETSNKFSDSMVKLSSEIKYEELVNKEEIKKHVDKQTPNNKITQGFNDFKENQAKIDEIIKDIKKVIDEIEKEIKEMLIKLNELKSHVPEKYIHMQPNITSLLTSIRNIRIKMDLVGSKTSNNLFDILTSACVVYNDSYIFLKYYYTEHYMKNYIKGEVDKAVKENENMTKSLVEFACDIAHINMLIYDINNKE